MDWMIRDALEQSSSFSDAVIYCQNTKMSSPGYVIIGGLSGNQGVVLSRDRDGTAEERWIHEESDNWYVLETNSDIWDKQHTSKRYQAALKDLSKVGEKGITLETMREDVLNIPPVLQPTTVFTTTMSASLDVFETKVQNS